jgi:hypothetical protein
MTAEATKRSGVTLSELKWFLSSESRKTPPPTETWLTFPPGPDFWTASALVRDGLPEGLSSTAKTSTSNLPIGPFHIMVPENLMIPEWRPSVLVPMSGPHQRSGKVGL